jgi:Family of unknown function (DUF6510)
MDDQHLDGNGVAGLLSEITGADLTELLRTCQSCRERRPIGEHLAYRSAGLVLRCPNCGDIAVVVGMQDTQLVVEWRGIYKSGR